MSTITNVILTYSVLEDESIVARVDTYPDYGGGVTFGKPLSKASGCGCVGGHKELEAEIRVGAFNHFMLEDFLEYLRKRVVWTYPERVRVFVQRQDDDAFEEVFQ